MWFIRPSTTVLSSFIYKFFSFHVMPIRHLPWKILRVVFLSLPSIYIKSLFATLMNPLGKLISVIDWLEIMRSYFSHFYSIYETFIKQMSHLAWRCHLHLCKKIKFVGETFSYSQGLADSYVFIISGNASISFFLIPQRESTWLRQEHGHEQFAMAWGKRHIVSLKVLTV